MSMVKEALRRIAGRRLLNDWHAFKSQVMLFRWFRNWREIWSAEQAGRDLPPLMLRGGLEIHHGQGDSPLYIFKEIFVEECYTRSNFFRPRRWHTVLDLGANIGSFAIYLQWRARGIRVHCFEPAEETRNRLEQNIRINNLDKHVSVYPLAVSDRPGVAYLKQARKTGVRSLFENKHSIGVGEEVECISLQQALDQCGVDRVDFLKVDVEGAEIEVFEGACGRIWNRIERVALEFHDVHRAGCRNRVLHVLRANGFNRLAVDHLSPDQTVGIIRAAR
jgi:FkbM family methyltransferase